MIFSNKQIAKALIRLHGCAGWSAPLLFANPEDKFSRIEAKVEYDNLANLLFPFDDQFSE